MKCSQCNNKFAAVCEECKKMQKEGSWKWEIDNGTRIIRCPVCGFGQMLGAYQYTNPYKYCASCGRKMIEDKGEAKGND